MKHLTATADDWTVQAIVASRYLTKLYRGLGDEKQASNAIQVGALMEERAQRLGLLSQAQQHQTTFQAEQTDTTQGEAQAWQVLVEALAGLSAFYAIADAPAPKPTGLQGVRNKTNKAYQKALHSYRVAFPESMANQGIKNAIHRSAHRCTQTLLMDCDNSDPISMDDPAAREIHQNILQSLLAESR